MAMYARMAGFFALAFLLAPMEVTSARAEAGSMTDLVGNPTADLSPEGVFQRVDQSGDGKINRAELTTRKMNVFFVRDRDQDTHLSPEEFGSLSKPVFDALDKDGDGRISGFEFNQGELTKFETIDANGDDTISFEEFQSFRIQIKE